MPKLGGNNWDDYFSAVRDTERGLSLCARNYQAQFRETSSSFRLCARVAAPDSILSLFLPPPFCQCSHERCPSLSSLCGALCHSMNQPCSSISLWHCTCCPLCTRHPAWLMFQIPREPKQNISHSEALCDLSKKRKKEILITPVSVIIYWFLFNYHKSLYNHILMTFLPPPFIQHWLSKHTQKILILLIQHCVIPTTAFSGEIQIIDRVDIRWLMCPSIPSLWNGHTWLHSTVLVGLPGHWLGQQQASGNQPVEKWIQGGDAVTPQKTHRPRTAGVNQLWPWKVMAATIPTCLWCFDSKINKQFWKQGRQSTGMWDEGRAGLA